MGLWVSNSGMTTDLSARLARLDSTVISDALDALDLPPGTGELRPLCGVGKVTGAVKTVQLEPHDGSEPAAHIGADAIVNSGAGDVVVVANAGRTDVSCWGGLLSLGSSRRNIAGVIADGACRDIDESGSYGIGVFARSATPRTARGRLRQRSIGEPVSIAGIAVAEGDLVVADDSGVAFIPKSRAAEVIDCAEQIAAREAAIAADVRAGIPINRAMHDARLAGDATPCNGVAHKRVARDRLSELPTAAISDALDKLGLAGALHGIAALAQGTRACGPAYTARYEPVDANGGTVGDFLDEVPPGAVIVIDNDGRTECTVWGGIMTRTASARGIAGTVINGVCRDVSEAFATGYPMFSAGRFMRTGKDRVRLAATQIPLQLYGIDIRPNDIVCCDDDGVLVVPGVPPLS